jgi:hypothetical protein
MSCLYLALTFGYFITMDCGTTNRDSELKINIRTIVNNIVLVYSMFILVALSPGRGCMAFLGLDLEIIVLGEFLGDASEYELVEMSSS